MASQETYERDTAPYASGDLESPLLEGEYLIDEADPDWEPRLAGLETESPFLNESDPGARPQDWEPSLPTYRGEEEDVSAYRWERDEALVDTKDPLFETDEAIEDEGWRLDAEDLETTPDLDALWDELELKETGGFEDEEAFLTERDWEDERTLREGKAFLDEVAFEGQDGFEDDDDAAASRTQATIAQETLLPEVDEENAYPPDIVGYDQEDLFLEQERLLGLGTVWNLLSQGNILQRVQQLVEKGTLDLALVSRFYAGQIWNEDHLALEILFQRQPGLRPANLDLLSRYQRWRVLQLAGKHQRALTPIREQIVRPVFGNPANFEIGAAKRCTIQDLRAEVRSLGPLRGGKRKNGKGYWYKRDKNRSPRARTAIDSIVVHHMAYNRGNHVRDYTKVGAQYIVTADGQIAQLYDDLDFLNSSNGFNRRCIAIEFAGNFPSLGYDWWKGSEQPVPDRCYVTPAQIRAGRCLLATLKARFPGIQYLYAHRQSSRNKSSDPGPDVWFTIAEWALTQLDLTDLKPSPSVGSGQPIPPEWRKPRQAMPVRATTSAPAPAKPRFRPTAEMVRFVQQVLNAVEGERLAVDGDLGRRTRGALTRFRTQYGLGTGGALDAKTRLALVQRALEGIRQQSLFARIGVRNARTDEALIAFKSGRGLDANIKIDAATRAALAAALSRQPVARKTAAGPLDQILQIAENSAVARYRWKDRGLAPPGYVKGMALVYARVYCKLKAGDPAALEMSKANTGDVDADALALYDAEFRARGMRNDVDGADTLRHLFVLLIGHGMRESRGRYCEGRDRSARNTKATSAEAGLFQTSYNLIGAHPTLRQLFNHYRANPSGFLDVFREGVTCRPRDLENFGTGNGERFQRLSKASPAFAAEFTAVGLRNRMRHWGPVRRKWVEILPECDAMLLEVQKAVEDANLCPLAT